MSSSGRFKREREEFSYDYYYANWSRRSQDQDSYPYEDRRRKDRRSSNYEEEDRRRRSRNDHDYFGSSSHNERSPTKEEHTAATKTIESKDARPSLEICIDDDDEANEDLAYICELPNDISKEDLIQFICDQYQRVRNFKPEIIACSIRDYKNDACFKFQDAYHARFAEEVLNGVEWMDTEVCIPRWEQKYLNMFKFDSFVKAEEKSRGEEFKLPTQDEENEILQQKQEQTPPMAYEKHSPYAYFDAKQKVDNCVYIHNLSTKVKPKHLKDQIIRNYEKIKGITPVITACHLRSRECDACVEFESVWHTNLALEVLDFRSLKGKDIRVQQWNPKFTTAFVNYYVGKNERKKKIRDQVQHANDTIVASSATDTTASAAAKALLLPKPDTKLIQELDNWKNDNERLRNELKKITKDYVQLKAELSRMKKDNGGLHNRLNENDLKHKQTVETLKSDAATIEAKLRIELAETREFNKRQKEQVADLTDQLQSVDEKLSATEKQVGDTQTSVQTQQQELYKKQVKLEGVKKELNHTQRTLLREKEGSKSMKSELLKQRVKTEDMNRKLQNYQGAIKNENERQFDI